MEIWEYILGGAMLLFSIAMILVIILQEGNQKGVGVVTGGADTFFSKNKARSIDSFLSRWTKFFAIGFAVLIVAINTCTHLMK